nr:uncharacterized protein LOC131782294 [Pocillopora verrucosa]
MNWGLVFVVTFANLFASKSTRAEPEEIQNSPVVHTESGAVIGKIEVLPNGKSVYEYLGIPYAEPPVEGLRFAAPKPIKPWTGIKQATEFGATCGQPALNYPNAGLFHPGSDEEDCLFLNVFVPSTIKPDEKMVVMVFIYGGGYTEGSSSSYPGAVLAAFNDVIFLSFNYRIGILGFFNVPGTDITGNYGMLDQVLALKWVQNNIASLGGDPNKVTIFGESVGGNSVSLHLISPLSKGLFQRAIIQSGAASSPLFCGKVTQPKQLELFAKAINCPFTLGLSLVECARGKSANEIIKGQEGVSHANYHGPLDILAPVVDGHFLPDLPENLFNTGKFHSEVDVITGFTDNEGAMMAMFLPQLVQNGTSLDTFKYLVTKGLLYAREKSKLIEDFILFEYTNHADPDDKAAHRQSLMDVIGDAYFVAPALLEANALAKGGRPPFVYVFDYQAVFSPLPEWFGAVHGMDVPFVFGAPFQSLSEPIIDKLASRFSDIEKGLSLYVMKMWTDFAKYGFFVESLAFPVQTHESYDRNSNTVLHHAPYFKSKTRLLRFAYLELITGRGEIPKKHMCPNETLRLECRELKSSNEYIKWKVWDSNSLKFIEIAYCNNSQKCTLLSHSQEFDGIIVKGVSKESLIIKRSTREAKKRNVTFTCEVEYGSRTTNNPVVIDLSTKCIWAQEGSDVNLTHHLIKMVRQWTRVEDLYIRSMPDAKEAIAYCTSTQCKVLDHSWPGFRDRFILNSNAVMLKGIKGGDDGLEMKIVIRWRGERQEHFTLKIRLREEIPEGTNRIKSNSNQTFTELVRGFENSTVVQIESGKIVGKIESLPLGKSVLTYLGIPFAEPPVNELRFAAPNQAKPWTGIRQATDYKAACPQPDFPIPNVRVGEVDEDCLYLNVFLPASTTKARDRKAVMVWIQGHNFTFGSSAHYPAHILASLNDVIVVTFNYRLGILGFLNIPGTDLKGNYGMQDQVMVLQWVNKNIASFGGDPNKVTIFGEGAGGISVSLHLISPLSKGLFQGAIIQSGFATSPILRGNGASTHTLKELKKVAKCGPDMELTRCLRSKSPAEIIDTQTRFSSLFPTEISAEITTPVPDGEFLPEFPQKLFKERRFPDKSVNVMIGLTSHEGALDLVLEAGNLAHVDTNEFEFTIKRSLGLWQNRDRHRVIEELVKYRYTDHNDPSNKTAIREMMLEFESDFKYLAPAMFEASALAETRERTYLYVFEHRPDFTQFPAWAGTVRGMDVSFVFGAPFKKLSSLIDYFTPRFSEIEKGFSLYMMKLWTDFAKFGSPTPPGSSKITWRQFTKDEQFYVALDVKPRLKQRFRASQVAFWNVTSKIGRRGRKGKTTPRSYL